MGSKKVIFMAGGKGERFWPMSTAATPKHLLELFDGKSLMRLAIERLQGLVEPSDILIITSRPQLALMREQTKNLLLPANIIAEPEGRDTAAAVALATRLALADDPQCLIAMLPADPFIRDSEAFRRTLSQAFDAASDGKNLLTIGIRPTFPATGYGYLERGVPLNPGVHKVARFKEKPNAATATEYLQSGAYFWNAGMFVWRADAIVRELKAFTPDIWEPLEKINPRDEKALAQIYPTLRKISIDYAVMERASNIAMVEAAFDWTDAGAWDSFATLRPTDSQNNVAEGPTAKTDCRNSLLLNQTPDRLLAGFGLEDMVVVQTPTATLVAPKHKAAELKKLLKEIGENEKLKKFVE